MDLKEFQKKFREGFSGKKYEDMSPEEKEKHLREKNKSQSFSGFQEGGLPEQDLIERFQALQNPVVTEDDVIDAELAKVNDEAKSPYQQTKPELAQDEVQQEAAKTPVGQAVQEVDPMLTKYKEAISKYEEQVNAPKKEYGAMDALPDILTGLYNIGARAKGNVLPDMKMPNSIQNMKAQEEASRKEKAGGLQNLQNMYSKYLEMQKKNQPKTASGLDEAKVKTEKAKADYYSAKAKTPSQKVTEGEKVLDREFAKDYNEWASGGKADYEVNSKIFKDAIKGLKSGKVSTGTASGMGSRLPGYRSETREVEDQVRKAINGMLRATLGAQFTEKEGERIFAQTFDPFKSEEANVAAMEAELAKLEKRKNAIEDMGKYYTKKKTLSGYEVPAANSETREVKRKTKDGRTAIFNADTKEFIRYE